MTNASVLLASDHRGFELKTQFIAWLSAHGFSPKDLGTNTQERCDASDFAQKIAAGIKADEAQFGVLICGTGQAMAMTANRYKKIRAALCADTTTARFAREHNDANVLVLGAEIVGASVALDCLDIFLKTKFLGGRYAERRDKLTALGGL